MNKRNAILFVVIICLNACSFSNPYKHLKDAEELSRQEKYDAAIEAYHRHIKTRLELEDKPEWENPFFYLLVIGDLYLGQSKPKEAHNSYKQADEMGVDDKLVLDRYRYLASWYENKKDFEAAVSILKLYRERDSLLFDLMLDRIAKESVKYENEKKGKNE